MTHGDRNHTLRFAVVLVALALAASSTAQAAPEYLRLSYTGDTTTTMTVSWNTSGSTTTTEVQYGTTSGVYSDVATGSSFPADAAALGHIHEVTLTNLLSDTTYYYIAGDATDGYSAEKSFTTGPTQDPLCGAFSFVFVGDNRPDPIFGGGQNWPQILGAAAAHAPAFVLNGGDLVIEGDDIGQWIDFLGWTEPVASTIPFLPCIGNHDNGPGEGNTANYNQIFALPTSQGTYGSNTEDYYYFTFGNAIVAALSTESFSGGAIPFETQANWLDDVLTQNPRKWKFVFFHKPSYTHEVFFSISHAPNEESQNAAFTPVIDAHHVDVVLTSHNHWYERWNPSACATQGNPGSNDPCPSSGFSDGTVYIVSGGAGAFTIPGMLCGSPSNRAECSGDHHFILMSINNETLTLDTWSTDSNQIVDTVTINKTADNCSDPPGPDAGVDAGVPSDG
ncbi:MAG: metallophosphoesterase family protein, partial [bacterium]